VTTYRRTDLLVRTIEGEVVILDKRARKIHQLNATASLIWQCCDGNHTADTIASTIAERFDCQVHTIVDDVRSALRQLEVLGLIEATSGLS
jgi:coenzyme PQQ synthesis protein D (PqqD)